MKFLSAQFHSWRFMTLTLFIVTALLGTLAGTAFASSTTLQLSPRPFFDPKTFASTTLTTGFTAPSSTNALPPLKAVVAVGEIDGPNGINTLSEVKNLKLVEAELIARGVSVQSFYPPNDDWNSIKAAAAGAHFFIYGGHGIGDGNNPQNYGGMWFTPGYYVSPAEMIASLKLAPNAIVMLDACYASGSNPTESSTPSTEALRRVSQYSQPFFTNGAAAYFATWKYGAFQAYVINLFSGMTLGNAYKNYSAFDAATAESYVDPYFSNLALWLNRSGGSLYNNAFAGQANLTLQDLYSTTMVARPSPIVALATSKSSARTTKVTISSSTSFNFTWTAALVGTGSWAALSSASGSSGSDITITLNPRGLAKGTYQGTLRLHASANGALVLSPDQDIPITLLVTDLVYNTYIPNAIR